MSFLLRYGLITAMLVWGAIACAQSQEGARAPQQEPPQQLAENATLWPRTLESQGIKVTIYQPQLDAWDGRNLQGHAAIAAQFADLPQPLYGVVNLSGFTQVNKDTRTVSLSGITGFDVVFPSAPEREAAFVAAMRQPMLQGVEYMSLDHLQAAAAILEVRDDALKIQVRNNPPRIIFAYQPALLVNVDGEPHWQTMPSGIKRLLNTRVLLVQDGGFYYLHFLDGYLAASSLNGAYQAVAKPGWANHVEREVAGKVDMLSGDGKSTIAKLKQLPVVYVATQPTELIVMNGQPNYATLEGTNLLYVTNTSANVFKSMDTQKNYVLLSGRWFAANSLNGPWAYVSSLDLPADFKNIPDNSVKENVKASVAGTPQAREALIASQIPQTAQINRRTTTFKPTLDGPPAYAPITGTIMQYVRNSPDPIIKVGTTLYALHNAVWFTASKIEGPWTVATSVPPVIYTIPASSPLHYATYVKIYNVTDEYVEEGYTPGYYGAVVNQDGQVVYGSGYTYSSWTQNNWYGYPPTYGCGADMCWTPFMGWAFGFGFGLIMSDMWYDDYDYWYPPTPWWGPYYYIPPYYQGDHAAWGPNGWAATTGNVYHNWGSTQVVSRANAGFDAVSGNRFAGSYGRAYNSRTGTVAVGGRGAVQNVYSGRYAAGHAGAAYNPTSGAAAAGGRALVGGPDGHAVVGQHNVRTADGDVVRTGSVRTQDGSVFHVNNDVYGTRDGHVYRYNPDNPDHWQPLNQGAGLQGRQYEQRDFNRDRLNQDMQARQIGQQRSQAFQSHGGFGGGGFRGGGGGFGGGGFRGGGGFGGGGFGGGGFHGGGFGGGGFRR